MVHWLRAVEETEGMQAIRFHSASFLLPKNSWMPDMHLLVHESKIAQITGPPINATHKRLATSEAYSVHLAIRLLEAMLRWDCCCFTLRQSNELLIESVPDQVPVKRIDGGSDASSWTARRHVAVGVRLR